MCRNIKTLYNFEPPATKDEIRDASLQYVRKISGFREPSEINQARFEKSVKEITEATEKLVRSLKTNAEPRDREEEARKAHQRALKRFGK